MIMVVVVMLVYIIVDFISTSNCLMCSLFVNLKARLRTFLALALPEILKAHFTECSMEFFYDFEPSTKTL